MRKFSLIFKTDTRQCSVHKSRKKPPKVKTTPRNMFQIILMIFEGQGQGRVMTFLWTAPYTILSHIDFLVFISLSVSLSLFSYLSLSGQCLYPSPSLFLSHAFSLSLTHILCLYVSLSLYFLPPPLRGQTTKKKTLLWLPLTYTYKTGVNDKQKHIIFI